MLQLTFGETFKENQGAETATFWKQVLEIIYIFWLKFTYNCIMFFLGICTVTFWGILYSLVAWIQVWCIQPMAYVSIIIMKGCIPMITEPIRMCGCRCCGQRRRKVASEVVWSITVGSPTVNLELLINLFT